MDAARVALTVGVAGAVALAVVVAVAVGGGGALTDVVGVVVTGEKPVVGVGTASS